MARANRWRMASGAIAAVALLGSCGGDDDDTPAPPVTPPVQTTSITISGSVATGAAVEAAAVEVKCASGTGTATSLANGSYQVSLTGALPCVLRATKGTTVLHSLVAAGTTLPAVAQITPLSELLVSQLNGTPAAAMFDTFDATAQGKATTAGANTANGQVAAALSSKIDLSGDDLLKGTLVPASNGGSGNLLDQKLDALALALKESNLTLAQLSTALVAQPGQLPTALAAVPASHKACPALRSGKFGGIEAEDPAFGGDDATLDVTTGNVQYAGESAVDKFVAIEGDPCRFKIVKADGTDKEVVAVSRTGLVVSQFPEDGKVKPAIGIPRQTITQQELAGDWNYVGWLGPMANFTPMNGSFTLNEAGVKSNIKNYVGNTLSVETGTITEALVKDASTGNFLATENGVATGNFFIAHRTPGGQLLLVGNPEAGEHQGLIFATKRVDVVMPAVGLKSVYWQFELNTGGMIEMQPGQTDVLDVQGNVVKRRRAAVGNAPERIETLTYNAPRVGLRYRAPNACTLPSGEAVNCAGTIQMPVPTAGLSFSAGLAAKTFFVISVVKP